MDGQNVQEILNRQPFEPFRMVTASGESYTVRHPEMLALLRNRAVVALPELGDGEPSDRFAICDLRLVTAVEMLGG